ncbi:MAG: hypothetical protein LBO07_05220, partial [Coriobacteriales bacterium]|nr:hypothetical protein [Coriobacteriales bacterium]
MKRILGVSADAAGKLARVLLAAVLACGLLLLAAPAWAEEPGEQGQLEAGEPNAVATDGADGQGALLPPGTADESAEGVEVDLDTPDSEGAVPDAVEQGAQLPAAEGDAAPAPAPEDTLALTPLAADGLEPLATPIPQLQWARSYGGSNHDEFTSVTPTADGGFVAVGSSWSSDGDLSGNKGFENALIVKFDANGNKVWAKSYGGSDYDTFFSVIATSDGGYVAVGKSGSSNGDLPGNKGEDDAIIVKFDANGNKLWSRNYGGSKT